MVNLDEIKSVVILGDINTCKTNLAIHLLREYKKQGGERQIYLVGYPKQIDDFKTISFFKDLFKLTDSIIFIDEIQKYINIFDRRKVHELIELISFFAHNNNTLIFSTCLSQFITKAIESYVDCWEITRIMDLNGLKNGGKPKRIINDLTNYKCNKWSLALLKGEYIEHSDLNSSDENGIKTFKDQGIGKDWRVKPEFENGTKNCTGNGTKNCTGNGTKNCTGNGTTNGTKKVFLEKKVQKNVQKVSATKHNNSEHIVSDDEISKLAWGGKK